MGVGPKIHHHIIQTESDKAYKGTVVNRAIPSVDGGSHMELRLQFL